MVKLLTASEVAVAEFVLPDLVVVPLTHEASYPVIDEPPLDAGAVNATVALAEPAVTEVSVGAPGAVADTTADTIPEAALEPTRFTAFTVHV